MEKDAASPHARASSTVVILDYSIYEINNAHVSIVISNARWCCNVNATPFTKFPLAFDGSVCGRGKSVMFWCMYRVQVRRLLSIHTCAIIGDLIRHMFSPSLRPLMDFTLIASGNDPLRFARAVPHQ